MAKPATKWRKSPPELIAAFEAAFPAAPAQRRQMFGYPAGFVGGNMFTGLFQEDWFVRLSEPELAALLKQKGARLFEPIPGRQMKNYVVLPPDIASDRKALAKWLGKALEYAASLPAKGPAKKPRGGAAPKSHRSSRR